MSGASLAQGPGSVRPPIAAAPLDHGLFLMHLNKGREHIAAGRLAEARGCLERALRVRPGDETALDLLGRIYFKMDLRHEAFTVYRHLVQLHPEADVLHANLGILEFKEGRDDDARRRLETALLLNPANQRPRLYIGLIERRQGNLAACIRQLEAAGARALARRVRRQLDPARGETEAPAPDPAADTGPVAAVAPEETARPPIVDLAAIAAARCLEEAVDGATFGILPRSGPAGGDLLRIDLTEGVRLRPGAVARVMAQRGALRREGRPSGPMVTVIGRGRVEMAAQGTGPSRILLLRLEAGQTLTARPEAVLACDASVGMRSSRRGPWEGGAGGAGPRTAILLHGPGIAALACDPAARPIRIEGEDTLLCHGADVVCWSGELRSMAAAAHGGGLDELLGPRRGAAAPLCLAGEAQVLLDPPV
ncbi:MAG TPA: AIM24 family protein [Candidatus Polarisedimenticolia bacterium]|nr:AIM24 family protein [Candidatus Polarisedimenticolia bacterium]